MAGHRLRTITFGSLSLLVGAWLFSLPIAPFVLPVAQRAPVPHQPLIAQVTQPARWSDTLVVALSLGSGGVQQQPCSVAWTQTTPEGFAISYRLSLLMLADGQAHQYVVPVGTHPKWRYAISNVRLACVGQQDLDIAVQDVQLVRRPPWALDALLGRVLAPYMPYDPPWQHLALFVGALFAFAIALVCPWSSYRRRLGVAGVLIGGTAGLATVAKLVSVVGVLLYIYGPLNEQEALARTPSYSLPPALNKALVAAADTLPDGPVLLTGVDAGSAFFYRARALLYPRRVESINLDDTAAVQGRLQQGFVGVIEIQGSGQRPLPDWQSISIPIEHIYAWKAPGTRPVAPFPQPGDGAIARLLAGLGVVVAVGAAVAGLVGWRGYERWICAWPIGVSVLTWWMFSLSMARIPWAWWSIGLPLALVPMPLFIRAARSQGWASHVRVASFRWNWSVVGALVFLLLIVGVTLIATLLPFTDKDSWRVWSLKGRAFYLDGNMTSVLELPNLSRYTPGQPLVQAWGYLAMGGISERLVKSVFPLWYGACLGVVWLALRRWQRPQGAILWVLLLATTPVLLDHATLGNADLPLAVGLAASAVSICRWLETGERQWLVASALAVSGAAWLKLNGAFLGGWMLGIAVMIRLVKLRRQPQSGALTVLTGIVALGSCLALLLPWWLYARGHDFNEWLLGLGMLGSQSMLSIRHSVAAMLEALLLSPTNSALGLLGGGYGALWLVCSGAVVAGWRRLLGDPTLWFLLLAVLGGIVFYLVLFALQAEFASSAERYLLHIAPIMVLVAARATRADCGAMPTIGGASGGGA